MRACRLSSVLRDFSRSYNIRKDEKDVVHYTFSVPCDERGTTVVWAMHDNRRKALKDADDLLRYTDSALTAKTKEMNRQLNEEVPYFRCSEEKFVEILLPLVNLPNVLY